MIKPFEENQQKHIPHIRFLWFINLCHTKLRETRTATFFLSKEKDKNCSICCSCDILRTLHTLDYYHNVINDCHVLAALSCYRLSHRDSTFVNWIAEQHLHDRCGLRDRTCVGPRRVSGLPGPVRAEK